MGCNEKVKRRLGKFVNYFVLFGKGEGLSFNISMYNVMELNM